MDRRNFLAALLAAPGLLVRQADDAVEAEVAPTPAAPELTLAFGELVLTSGPDSAFKHNGRCPYDRLSRRYFGRGEATVEAVRFKAPLAVWNALYARYAKVEGAAARPPVVVRLGAVELLTLDSVVLTHCTAAWPAGDDPDAEAVGSVGLIGIWREMQAWLEGYYAAERAEAERLAALAPPPTDQPDFLDDWWPDDE